MTVYTVSWSLIICSFLYFKY